MKNSGQVEQVQNEGIYRSLTQQLDNVFRHANQGGFNTRETYEACLHRFCAHVADDYRLQSLKNIDSKHVYSYVNGMIERGLSTSSIYKELGAIRYLHGQLPDRGGRRHIPTTQEVREYLADKGQTLENRQTAVIERAWRPEEIERAISLAGDKASWWKVDQFLKVDRHLGFRVGGFVRNTVEQTKEALRTGVYHVVRGQEKHGRPRDIPLTVEGHRALDGLLQAAASRGIRSGYIVVDHRNGESMKKVAKSIENWIYRYRNQFADPDPRKKRGNLTAHGVRHRWFQDRLDQNLEKYGNIEDARAASTEEGGHHRDQILDTYTVGSPLHKVKSRR